MSPADAPDGAMTAAAAESLICRSEPATADQCERRGDLAIGQVVHAQRERDALARRQFSEREGQHATGGERRLVVQGAAIARLVELGMQRQRRLCATRAGATLEVRQRVADRDAVHPRIERCRGA